MRTLLIASTAAAALLVTAATAQTGGRPLTATLTGEAEVPVPGDPDGTGTARVTVNPGTGRVCYTIRVSGIAPATMAHIHEAPEGEPGPVVQGLNAPTSGSSSGCFINRELARELLSSPEDYYVNVHNVPFGGGALRGQLGK
jgi:Cu/Zn superoxide dismutase